MWAGFPRIMEKGVPGEPPGAGLQSKKVLQVWHSLLTWQPADRDAAGGGVKAQRVGDLWVEK
jgi:hypothetical protein